MFKNYDNKNHMSYKQISLGLTEAVNCPEHQWPFPNNPQVNFFYISKKEQIDRIHGKTHKVFKSKTLVNQQNVL